jgi:hypothetical protein
MKSSGCHHKKFLVLSLFFEMGDNDSLLRSAITKLIVNASTRSSSVANSSLESLRSVLASRPKIGIDLLNEMITTFPCPITDRVLLVFQIIFSIGFPFVDKDLSLQIFLRLQSMNLASKSTDIFTAWDSLCTEFITSVEIAKAACDIELRTPIALITYTSASVFVADEIAQRLEKATNILPIHPRCFIRFVDSLAAKATVCSQFLSAAFGWIFQYFCETPSLEVIHALLTVFKTIRPLASPTLAHQFANRLCEILPTFSEDILVAALPLLEAFCTDSEIIKRSVETILLLGNATSQTTEITQTFPILTTDLSKRSLSPSFTAGLAMLVSLCRKPAPTPHTVISAVLSAMDRPSQAVGFLALSPILTQVTLSVEQRLMILSSLSALTSKRVYEPALSQLALELLRMESLSEQDATAMTAYLVNSALTLGNGYFVTETVHVHTSQISVVYDFLSDCLL